MNLKKENEAATGQAKGANTRVNPNLLKFEQSGAHYRAITGQLQDVVLKRFMGDIQSP